MNEQEKDTLVWSLQAKNEAYRKALKRILNAWKSLKRDDSTHRNWVKWLEGVLEGENN